MAEVLAQQRPCCTIGEMDCPLCVRCIGRALSRLPGVENVQGSIAHGEVLVYYDLTLQNSQRVCNTLTDLGSTLREPDRLAPSLCLVALLAQAGRICGRASLPVRVSGRGGSSVAVLGSDPEDIRSLRWALLRRVARERRGIGPGRSLRRRDLRRQAAGRKAGVTPGYLLA